MPEVGPLCLRSRRESGRCGISGSCQQPTSRLFDYKVGTVKEERWHSQSKCLGGPEIDRSVQPGGQLDRPITWLCAFEKARRVLLFVFRFSGRLGARRLLDTRAIRAIERLQPRLGHGDLVGEEIDLDVVGNC
jgi:hypothetical protein